MFFVLLVGLGMLSYVYNSNMKCEMEVSELLLGVEQETNKAMHESSPPVVVEQAQQTDKLGTVQKSAQFDWKENAKLVRQWRKKLQQSVMTRDRQSIRQLRNEAFTSKVVFQCEYTLLDLGANVGDTFRKLIDAGLPKIDNHQWLFDIDKPGVGSTCYNCPPREKDARRETWTLPNYLKTNMKGMEPEDFCYYGVEGNPVFTSRLKELEIKVLNMHPRPVRHVHFFTEHIATGKDGPSTLYLDTVNNAENFWGSSIYKSHWDVVKSGKNTGTNVMGITLTTLLKRTVKPGGHVIAKVDIEGAEYVLMEEAIKSNILCHLIKEKGVTMSLVLEPHEDQMLGSSEPRLRWERMKGNETIINCGVNLYADDMDW